MGAPEGGGGEEVEALRGGEGPRRAAEHALLRIQPLLYLRMPLCHTSLYKTHVPILSCPSDFWVHPKMLGPEPDGFPRRAQHRTYRAAYTGSCTSSNIVPMNQYPT